MIVFDAGVYVQKFDGHDMLGSKLRFWHIHFFLALSF